jgi:hypothetical protein
MQAPTSFTHFQNMNFSLMNQRAGQRKNQIAARFEAFKVFNFRILGTPNVTLGQSPTGLITRITSTPRQLIKHLRRCRRISIATE